MKKILQKFLIIGIFRAFCKFARYNKRKLFDRITPLQELNLVYYKKKFFTPCGMVDNRSLQRIKFFINNGLFTGNPLIA